MEKIMQTTLLQSFLTLKRIVSCLGNRSIRESK